MCLDSKGKNYFKVSIISVVGVVLFLLPVGISFSQKLTKKEPLVTNVFYDADIREVLRDISAQVGIPIIPDQTVQGTMTIELKDVPLEKCLRMILSGGGYTFRKMDNYYLIGLAVLSNPTFNDLTKTELIKPKYIKATDISLLLSEYYRDYVRVNKETNTLTVTAPPELLEQIKEKIIRIDVPPRQVMVETIVTEISKDAMEDLGIDWSWMWAKPTETPSVAQGSLNIQDFIGELRYTTTGEFTREFWASLRLLIEKGKAYIRANPRIATLEGREATIHIGKEEYHLIDVGTPAYPYRTLEAIQAGITLKITPYISGSNEVTVQLASEVSDITGRGPEGLPLVSKRTATTVVRVNDSETIIIGGLLQDNKLEQISKVPLLGSLPGVGALFTSKKTVVNNSELVIFVIPHIWNESQKELLIQKKTNNLHLKDAYTWGEYNQVVHTIITNKIKNYPYVYKYQGKANVNFVLTKEGTVRDVSVSIIEGKDLVLKDVVAQCINSAVPYPEFPQGVKEQKKKFSLSINFEGGDAQFN